MGGECVGRWMGGGLRFDFRIALGKNRCARNSLPRT